MSGTQTNITIPDTHSSPPSSNTGTEESLEVAEDTSAQGVVYHIDNIDQSQFSSTAEEPTEVPPQIAGRASIPPVKIDGTQKMSHTPPPSNKMEETNETPPQIVDPVVVSSNEGVDEASRIRQIRKTMDEAAAHGLAHFKIVMNEFVDSKKL
ncbi:unnamed protein product [Allacma fusca]|uniref:Uncharacterized protein n=1 Tax=Allacma fusca TaxID=39272 RepID=A0A8J2NU43_9HEXA|nr:unnamed protein product [Allacma fusca]